MCTNGSRSSRCTPAKARRTGKPSPSSPRGAVVTDFTGRSAALVRSGAGMAGSLLRSLTVTAGTTTSQVVVGQRPRTSGPSPDCRLCVLVRDLSGRRPAPSVEVSLPVRRDLPGRARGGLGQRVMVRRRQLGAVVVLLGLVVPEPVLTRLEAPNDCVTTLL